MKSATSFRGFLLFQFIVAAVLPVIVIATLVWVFMVPAHQAQNGIRHLAMARSIAAGMSACLKGGEGQRTGLSGDFQVEPGWLTLVLDDRGMIVADSRNLRQGQMLNISFTPARKSAGKAPLSFKNFELDGERMAGSLVEMARPGWRVLVAQPARYAFKPIRDTYLLMVLGLAIALVLIFAIFRLYAGRFANLFKGGMSMDTPRRKEMEASLLLTQFCFDSTAVGIYHLQSDMRIVNVNEAAARMLGYTIEELSGLSVWDIDPVATEESLRTSWQRLAASGVDTFETIHVKKDGSRIPVEITSNLLEYDGRRFSICFVQDITERKRMEESLWITQFSVDNANVGIYRISREGRILEVNQKATKLLGYTKAELESLSISDIDPLVARDSWDSHWQQLVVQGMRTLEREHLKKDGSVISVEIFSNLLEYEHRQYAIAFVQDITGRKQMEESLRITQCSFDNANVAIHLLNPDGQIREANQQFAQQLGYTREELKGMFIHDVDPSVTHETWGPIWQVLVEEGYCAYKIEHRRKNGSVIPVEVYANYLEYNGQEYVIAFAQDISRRKEMELALKESEERLELALAGANEGIWDWRINEDILYLDSRYYTMAGYQPGAFPASFDEILKRIHKDDLERTKSVNDRYLAGELETFDVEFRFRRQDGTYMWIHSKGRIVARDDEGNPVRFSGTNIDISDRKQAEEALRENEQLLNNILESMTEGLFVLNSDFQYTIFNSSLEKMGDTPREVVLGNIPWEIFPSLKGTPVEKNINRAMNGELSGSMEIQVQLRGGEMVWFRDSFSPLKNDEGDVIGVVGVVSDISQQKQTENEREELLKELRKALENVKILSGLLPICASCKKIRDDKGYWNQIEYYISEHTEAEFSHGICPDCAKKLYPDLDIHRD